MLLKIIGDIFRHSTNFSDRTFIQQSHLTETVDRRAKTTLGTNKADEIISIYLQHIHYDHTASNSTHSETLDPALTMTVPTSPSLPKTQTVIRQQEDCSLGISQNVPLPPLYEPEMILIKTVAVPLNPCDWKMPARFPCPGATDGCDFAGIIVQISPNCTRQDLNIGDKVFGAVHGSNPARVDSGSFAEYIAAFADFVFKVPDGMSWEEAAAFGGIGIGTIGVGLFYSLKLPGTIQRPAEKPCFVLVNGGASASGTMAIQCLKL